MTRNIQAAFARARPELRRSVRYRAAATAALLVLAAAGVAQAATGDATEFGGLSAGANPVGIAAGHDGNLWFAELNANKIGTITTSGAVTEYSVTSSSDSGPDYIAPGPDGAMWFTEFRANKIGRITTSGAITEYATNLTANAGLHGITAGPDGNLWFVEADAGKIGRITPTGVITEFPIPTPGSYPWGITAGPDGNLWFTEVDGNKIGRITPAGVITEFPTLTAGNLPTAIVTGSDNNLWVTENFFDGHIARVLSGVGTNPPPPSGSGGNPPPPSVGGGNPPPPSGGGGSPPPPQPSPASCSLKAQGNMVVVHKSKKNSHAQPGTVSLLASCNQAATVTLAGTLTQVLGKHAKTVGLPTLHASLNAGTAAVLAVKLPATALAALRHGAKASAAFTLTATNANGTSHASATVARFTVS
ncbi:MAG: Vgb family protein [Solirubrobacteraceae bacterium]